MTVRGSVCRACMQPPCASMRPVRYIPHAATCIGMTWAGGARLQSCRMHPVTALAACRAACSARCEPLAPSLLVPAASPPPCQPAGRVGGCVHIPRPIYLPRGWPRAASSTAAGRGCAMLIFTPSRPSRCPQAAAPRVCAHPKVCWQPMGEPALPHTAATNTRASPRC